MSFTSAGYVYHFSPPAEPQPISLSLTSEDNLLIFYLVQDHGIQIFLIHRCILITNYVILSYRRNHQYTTIVSSTGDETNTTIYTLLKLHRLRMQATVNAIPEASPYATPPGTTSLRLLLGHKTHLDLCLCCLGSLKICGPQHCTIQISYAQEMA